MVGGIDEIRFEIPENIKKQASNFMDKNVLEIVRNFIKKHVKQKCYKFDYLIVKAKNDIMMVK